MKNSNKYTVLLAFFAFAINLQVISQINYRSNNFLIWSAAGYSANNYPLSEITQKGGTSYSTGFGFEHNYYHFQIRTGLDFSFNTSNVKITDSSISAPLTDSEGMAYTGIFDFTNHYGSNRSINFGLPVMMGYRFFNGMYFLVGAKWNYNLSAVNVSTANLTKRAIYSQLIGDNSDGVLSDIPNHGLMTKEISVIKTFQYKDVFTGSLELGFDLNGNIYKHNKTNKPDIRFAFFLDCNFAQLKNNSSSFQYVNFEPDDVLLPDYYVDMKHFNFNNLGFKLIYTFTPNSCNCRWLTD